MENIIYHNEELLTQLSQYLSISSIGISSWYLNPPAPGSSGDWYHNAIIAFEWAGDLAWPEMLNRLKKIETKWGRTSSNQWGEPRPLDLDIICAFSQQQFVEFSSKDLIIPHYAALKRPFVLWPLKEIKAKYDVEFPTFWQENFESLIVGDHIWKFNSTI